MPAAKNCATCGHPKMFHRHNKRKDGKMHYHGCSIVYNRSNAPCPCRQYIEPPEPKPLTIDELIEKALAKRSKRKEIDIPEERLKILE